MDVRSISYIGCCSRTIDINLEHRTTGASLHHSDQNSNGVSTSNKRKRRATLDEKDTDECHEKKRINLSEEKSETSSPLSSNIEEILQSEEIIAPVDSCSSSECFSTAAEYDLCALGSPSSPSGEVNSPQSCNSNSTSCNSWHIRGDITPHSNKKRQICSYNKLSTSNSYCKTPTSDIRLCPLPALSWANAADVWNLMCQKDLRASLERDPSMLDYHPGLQPRMRAILLDWLIEVCEVYKLHRETYYLAVDYIDRYLLANKRVQKTHLQLIGITCLFVAAKVEEIYPPKIGEFAYVTDGACQEEDILQHELLLLKALDWSISPVTIMGWLGVYMQLNVSNRTPLSFLQKQHYKKIKISSHSHTNASTINSNLDCTNNLLNSTKDNKNLKNNNINSHINNSYNCKNDSSATVKSTPNYDSISAENTVLNCNINTDLSDDLSTTIVNELDDAFIYPQFSGMEFAQTAQLIDLCSLDLGLANFSYSVIAAAAMSHTFNQEIATRVSGLEWNTISPCARWMEPFFQVVCEESQYLCLMEQNEEVKSQFGLGHICPNIITDDSHIIQTHTISMAMFDRAMVKKEQENLAVTLVQQEASPALGHTYIEGMLTPPASNRKPLECTENDPELQNKTN